MAQAGQNSTHVVHIIAGLGLGGAERSLVNLVNHDRTSAPRQTVINLLGGEAFEAAIQESSIATHALGVRRASQVYGGLRRLTRLLRDLQPDVIQSWMYNADLMAYWAWRRANLTSTRLYWGIRCSDMDLSQYSRRLRWTVSACARRSSMVTGIIANSHAGRTAHERLGYQSSLFEIIENGININSFRPYPDRGMQLRKVWDIDPNETLALHVARVDPMKDHALLADVARRCPNIKFIAVGAGTEQLQGPPNLKGIGAQRDLAPCYAAADVAVLTSAYGEGFPNVLGEAMACGTACVATDVGDAARIVGDTGKIVPPRDPAAFAAALDAVLSNRGAFEDPRDRIVRRFALDRSVARFDALHRTGAIPPEPEAVR